MIICTGVPYNTSSTKIFTLEIRHYKLYDIIKTVLKKGQIMEERSKLKKHLRLQKYLRQLMTKQCEREL